MSFSNFIKNYTNFIMEEFKKFLEEFGFNREKDDIHTFVDNNYEKIYVKLIS